MGDVAASPKRPKGRTLEEFLRDDGTLPPAEQLLLDACAGGGWAVIPPAQIVIDAADRLTRIPQGPPGSRDEANSMRAEFVRFLALGGDTEAVVHERALRVAGAWIQGALDLDGCKVPTFLEFFSCTIDGPLNLVDADIRGLNLRNTHVAAIEADRLRCDSAFALTDTTRIGRTVNLSGAHINGVLICACLINLDGGAEDALTADGAEINGGVYLNAQFHAKGQVSFSYAKIAGFLLCEGGGFELPSVTTDKSNVTRWALKLDQANIGGDVFLGSQEYIEKLGDVERKTASFRASGGVSMHTGRIGGSLFCMGGHFEGSKGSQALLLEGTEIKGSVYLSEDKDRKRRFTAKGLVQMVNARIHGDLICSGGSFDGGQNAAESKELAIFGDYAKITGSVLLNDGFQAVGGVRFHGGMINGNLDCENGRFDSDYRPALDLENSNISAALCFRGVRSIVGRVTLSAAHAATLDDDAESWNAVPPHSLDVDGFRYDRLAEQAPTDVKTRIAWLGKQKQDYLAASFRPQPWDQLAKVLRVSGYGEAATGIAIEKHWRQRKNIAGWFPRGLQLLYGWLYGFGYRPERVLYAAALPLWLVCAIAFWCGAKAGAMVPTDSKVAEDVKNQSCEPNWTECAQLVGRYTTFQPIAYSLDYILPIIELDQKKKWAPRVVCESDSQKSCALGVAPRWMDRRRISLVGLGIAILTLIENLFGWIAGGVLAAVMGGLIKKD